MLAKIIAAALTSPVVLRALELLIGSKNDEQTAKIMSEIGKLHADHTGFNVRLEAFTAVLAEHGERIASIERRLK